MNLCHVAIQPVGQALWKQGIVVLGTLPAEKLWLWEINVRLRTVPPGKEYVVVKTLRMSRLFLERAVAGTLRNGLDELAARIRRGLADSTVIGWHDNNASMDCVPTRSAMLYTGWQPQAPSPEHR